MCRRLTSLTNFSIYLLYLHVPEQLVQLLPILLFGLKIRQVSDDGGELDAMKKEKAKLVKLVMDMYRLEVKDINVNVKYSDNLVQYIGELEGKKKDGKEVIKLFMDLEDLEEEAKDGNHDHGGH